MNRRTRIGYALMFAELLFGGMVPVLGKLSYASITPIYSIAFCTLIASLFFAVVLTIRGTWKDVFVREIWPELAAMTVLIVVGFYGCMFVSLHLTSATNVAILSRFEILTTILLLGIISRHERVTAGRAAGAVLVLTGVVVALFAGATRPNLGDLIMIVGTFFTPFGNLFQQRSRDRISGEAVYFFRSLFGGLLLLVIAFVFEASPNGVSLRMALPFLLAAGILVFGFGKLFFVEALHRLPITVAIPLGALSTIVTIAFAAAVLDEPVRLYHVLALLPIFAGIMLLSRSSERVMDD